MAEHNVARNLKPPPRARAPLPLQARCSPAQLARLQRGLPAADGQPWAVVHEEPWILVYRDDDCVFGVRFEREDEDTFRTAETWVTREPHVLASGWFGEAGGASVEGNVAFLNVFFFSVLNPGAPMPAALREMLDRASGAYPSEPREGVVYAVSDSPELDPLQEAEVYLAYGRDAQAQEILEEAIARGDARPQLREKLRLLRQHGGGPPEAPLMQLKAPPAAHAALAVSMRCSPGQFEQLRRGKQRSSHFPWEVRYDEPWVHVFNYAGHCLFGARFERAGARYACTDAWVTRDPAVISDPAFASLGGDDLDGNGACLQLILFRMLNPEGEVPPAVSERLARAQKAADRARGAESEAETVDPLAEAEVYAAYGRDAQAREILEEAMARGDSRASVLLALLDVYARLGDAARFFELARRFRERTGERGAEWEAAMARAHDRRLACTYFAEAFTARKSDQNALLLVAVAAFASAFAIAILEPPDVFLLPWLAAPWAVLWLCWRRPERFRLTWHRGLGEAMVILFGGFALLAKPLMRHELVAGGEVVLPWLAALALIGVVLARLDRALHTTWSGAFVLAALMLLWAPHAAGIVRMANYVFDREPGIHRVRVHTILESLPGSRGGGDDLTIEDWAGTGITKVTVAQPVTRAAKADKHVCIRDYRGALAIRWYRTHTLAECGLRSPATGATRRGTG